jgi:hypothetical protein
MIAGLWIFVLLGVFILQVTTVVTYSVKVSGDIGVPLAREIGKEYDDWLIANDQPSYKEQWGLNTRTYYQWVNTTDPWLEEHLAFIIKDAGGLFRLLDGSSALHLIPVSIVAFLIGVFWSIVLLGASRPRVAIVPVVGACASILLAIGYSAAGPVSMQAVEVARNAYLFPVAVAMVVLELSALFLGIFLGRRIARCVLVLALPPQTRVPFSIFWTRDGLELPSAKR